MIKRVLNWYRGIVPYKWKHTFHTAHVTNGSKYMDIPYVISVKDDLMEIKFLDIPDKFMDAIYNK